MRDKANRKRVTFEWNREDVLAVIASGLEQGTPYKWLDFPQPNYASSSADKVMRDGEIVGMSMFNGYSFNERCFLSLGVVAPSVEIGDVLTWSGVSLMPAERHQSRRTSRPKSACVSHQPPMLQKRARIMPIVGAHAQNRR